MQHLLKTMRFTRRTVGTPTAHGLETYLFAVDRAAESRPADPVVPRHQNRARAVLERADEELSVAR